MKALLLIIGMIIILMNYKITAYGANSDAVKHERIEFTHVN